MDFDGKVLLEEKHPVKIEPLSSQVYLEWPLEKISAADSGDPSQVFVEAEVGNADKEISRNLSYLAPTKEVHLKTATLKVETSGENGSYTMRVTSPVLARDVYISFGNLDVKLSDNYFDVLPGQTVVIIATGAASLADLKSQLKVISLTDAFPGNNQQPVLHE